MYWDDLRALIRRNQAPNAFITYYYDPRINPRQIGIFDRNILHRRPNYGADTGYAKDDHWRDSHVCEAAWHGGEIPMESNKSIGNLYRGALGVLERLINEGCIERSDELRLLFHRHGRRLPELL